MKEVTYYYRGSIEVPCQVGGRPSYRWAGGYSETSSSGAVVYPWMTKTECRADVKKRGLKAVFVNSWA